MLQFDVRAFKKCICKVKKNLKLRVVVHSAGTGRPGKHQKLGDGSMFQEGEDHKSIDFEDYDFYQSVYPKVVK